MTLNEGYTLKFEDGLLKFFDGEGYDAGWLNHLQIEALREFFMHGEDERLGRWRWPEDPDHVVYPYGSEKDGFRVLQESTGETWTYYLSALEDRNLFSGHWDAARAYFASQEERKPWHDAKHNEIWVLFVSISEEAYRVDGDAFVPVNNPTRIRIPLTDPGIESAHRIFPEGN